MTRPDSTSGPTGCSLNSNDVTTPKFPPPPRIAQKRSGNSSALVRTTSPLASTTSAEIRLSIVSPKRRLSQPKPPPSVRPATPVVELTPRGVARLCSWAARSKSPSVAPPPTRAVRAVGFTSTDRIGERSIMRPPSQRALPAMLCPPPRTASTRSCRRAKRTACETSAVLVQLITSPGRRSIIAFQIVHASVNSGDPGLCTRPGRLEIRVSYASAGNSVFEPSHAVSVTVICHLQEGIRSRKIFGMNDLGYWPIEFAAGDRTAPAGRGLQREQTADYKNKKEKRDRTPPSPFSVPYRRGLTITTRDPKLGPHHGL